MLVVSDTSPLTALLQIDRQNILPMIFEQILIPPSVAEELLRFHQSLPSFLSIHPVSNQHAVDSLCNNLSR